MQYRREIDGLRALAVVPVVFFHAGLSAFDGGYVGVDIFFVISGYLITGILIKELEDGSFSIASFYERRARRILPALFLVIACSLPFAWAWMVPAELEAFGRSIVAVTLFVSNVLFFREDDYFAAAADLKPLLHTWSLAVEEQYYLVFPLFLALAWRFGRRKTFWTITVVALVSLGLSEIAWRIKPSANFYLAPTRVWELLAGSLCAFIYDRTRLMPFQWLSLLGLAMIAFAVFVFDAATPFPSLYAAIPVGGSALVVLFAQPSNLAGRFLGSRVLVAIGLISYSVYLWHQPLLAFARIRANPEATPGLLLGLSALSFVLGAVSWKYIEQPFRAGKRSVFQTRRTVFIASALAGLALICCGAAIVFLKGSPDRLPPAALAYLNEPAGDGPGCNNLLDVADVRSGKICAIGTKSMQPSVALIGDSHASVLSGALDESFKQFGLSGAVYANPWCVPLLNLGTDAASKNRCSNKTEAIFQRVTSKPTIRTVVLFAEWPAYDHGQRWPDTAAAIYRYDGTANDCGDAKSVDANLAALRCAMRDTFTKLAASGKQVIVVLPVPEYDYDVRISHARSEMYHDRREFPGLSRADYLARAGRVRTALMSEAVAYGFSVYDPAARLCDNLFCAPKDRDGQLLYSDANHLSLRGARPLAEDLATMLLRPVDRPAPNK